MSKELKVESEFISGWEWAKKAALKTVGLRPKTSQPTNSWKAKMLLAQHSVIRSVRYYISIDNIRMWVTTHLVRHNVGMTPYVHTQREDRTDIGVPRDDLPQGALNDMAIDINAQALINVSRKRLCNKASKETKEAWTKVKESIRKIDPIMADKMVPECVMHGFCTEMECCGFCNTKKFQEELEKYRKTNYDD